ncbi:hypothetical protein DYB31_007135 [Aphanomyces astaci]|uniref:Uncharacterized protein n=1 Tax=Aphanomyces astaci TaxID=112090 RepID=A0A397F1T3_APHAT|nr:hypothetical protein DYB31_007135 [Aphanomyces astaci]
MRSKWSALAKDERFVASTSCRTLTLMKGADVVVNASMLDAAMAYLSTRDANESYVVAVRSMDAAPLTSKSVQFHSRGRLPVRNPPVLHRQADAGAAGLGLIAGGIVVTNATSIDVYSMSIVDLLTDSFAMVSANVQNHWDDDNRRLLMALIATNTAVFGMWKVSQRHAGLAKFMWTHFACSFHGVATERRVHTLVTSAFSHQTPLHFGINMFMLWHFGSAVLPPSNHDASTFRRRQPIQGGTSSWLPSSMAKQHRYVVHEPRTLDSREFAKIYATSAIASSVLSAVVSGLRGMGHAVNVVGSVFQHAQHRALAALVPNVDFVGHLGGQAAAYAILPK